MRLLIVSIMTILFTQWAIGQRLFKGETTFSKVLIYSIEDENIYKVESTWNDPLYSFNQNGFYLGSSAFRKQMLFNFQGKQVYLASNNLGREVMYTIRDNKIYAGDSSFSTDCLFTVSEGKIYRGDSTFISDILFTLETDVEIDLRVLACLIGPY